MSNFLVSLFWVYIVHFLTQCIYTRYLHPLSRYPGPVLASFTNLWRLLNFHTGQSHLHEAQLHARHGPVVRVGPNALLFSTVAAFDTIYGFNPGFQKGDFFYFGRDNQKHPTNLMGARTLDAHRPRRKIVGGALNAERSRAYAPVVERHVQGLLSKLESARGAGEGTATLAFNAAPMIQHTAFDLLMEIVFGPAISSAASPWTSRRQGLGTLAQARKAVRYAFYAPMVPAARWVMASWPVMAIMRRPRKTKDGELAGFGALRVLSMELILGAFGKENPRQGSKESVLGHGQEGEEVSGEEQKIDVSERSVAAELMKEQNGLLPRQVWGETFNLTLAGPETTNAAMTAVLYQLGKGPVGRQWQERIRKECIYEEIAPLDSPVVVAVVKETLRLNPSFAMSFPREVYGDARMAIPGLKAPLPEGAEVAANIYVVGRDTEWWGEDAEEWKPERWLKDTEASEKHLEKGFVAFGRGPRSCIGRDLAMLEICAVVVGVLERWWIAAEGELVGKCWAEMQYETCNLRLLEIGF